VSHAAALRFMRAALGGVIELAPAVATDPVLVEEVDGLGCCGLLGYCHGVRITPRDSVLLKLTTLCSIPLVKLGYTRSPKKQKQKQKQAAFAQACF
jgi:hypothetical protein